MLLLLFFLFTVLSLTLLLLGKPKYSNPSLRPPPGPKGLAIIGNLHQYDFSAPHVYLANLAKLYGPTLSLRFGRIPIVVVQSAKMAKEVSQTQDLNFCSRPLMVATQRLSYSNMDVVFCPYGEYFREMKKISVTHLLSSKRTQSFAPIRQEEIVRLINKISSLSSAQEVVNLSELLMAFGSSNICSIAFGKRYEEVEGSRSRFHSLLNEAQALFMAFFFRDHFPYLGWIDRLNGQMARLEQVFKDFDIFYEEIIKDHLDPKRRPESEQDQGIIDVLLQLKSQQSFGFELTNNHIKAMLMNIFVAGTDTSTAMMVWAMSELIKNPNAMKKVQQELRNIADKKGHISGDDLQNADYFKAVIKETFRMHPAAPLLVVRESIRKTTIDGYHIQPGTLVYVNVWAIGRDPQSWSDPEVFMPERFIGSSIDYKGQDFELIPFGAGRRICPGLALGVANLEYTLAHLLCFFDWELPSGLKKEDIDTKVLPGVTMHKKNPLCLIARKIKS